jgi:hypothetical protein
MCAALTISLTDCHTVWIFQLHDQGNTALLDYDTKILIRGNLNFETLVPAALHVESAGLTLRQSLVLKAGPSNDRRYGPCEERQKQAGADVEPARSLPVVRTFDHDNNFAPVGSDVYGFVATQVPLS